jgi:hypothetical protein
MGRVPMLHPSTNQQVPGSAVRIRHYPVTVSVESRSRQHESHWSYRFGKAASIR